MAKTPSNSNPSGDFPEEFGAVWVKTSQKDGKQYLSISVKSDLKAGTALVGFKNKNKTQPNHPDFRLFESRPMGATTPAAAPKTAEVEVPNLAI